MNKTRWKNYNWNENTFALWFSRLSTLIITLFVMKHNSWPAFVAGLMNAIPWMLYQRFWVMTSYRALFLTSRNTFLATYVLYLIQNTEQLHSQWRNETIYTKLYIKSSDLFCRCVQVDEHAPSEHKLLGTLIWWHVPTQVSGNPSYKLQLTPNWAFMFGFGKRMWQGAGVN